MKTTLQAIKSTIPLLLLNLIINISPLSMWGFSSLAAPGKFEHNDSKTAFSSAINSPLISIIDPCTCLNNSIGSGTGQFSETIIVSAELDQSWYVIDVYGLYESGAAVPPLSSHAIVAGTMLDQIDPEEGEYFLENVVHIDGQGYSLTVTNGIDTLSISNKCFYPDPSINLLPNYCVNYPPFSFEVTAEPYTGSFEVTVDGSPENIFNPALLGPGVYEVAFTFYAEFLNDSMPGCIESGNFTVEITPNYIGSLSCKSVNVGLNEFGYAHIVPDMVLSTDFGCSSTFLLDIVGRANDTLYCSDIGQVFMVKVTDPIRNNTCWGNVIVEDKRAPDIECRDTTVSCATDFFGSHFSSFIEVSDNCDDDVTLTLLFQSPINNPSCNPEYSASISRTYRAIDDYDNSSTCQHTIYFDRVALEDISAPADTIISCSDDIDLSIENLGIPHVNGIPLGYFCEVGFFYVDLVANGCPGTSVIKRRWTIMDLCSPAMITLTQKIMIVDDEAPQIVCPPNLTLNNSPGLCGTNYEIPQVEVNDNCAAEEQLNLQVFINGAYQFPGNNNAYLTVGLNEIVYIVNDPCYNFNSCTQYIWVNDIESPTLACNPITVSLDANGEATLHVSNLNFNYYDNCGIADTLIARMDQLMFGKSVSFSCEDIGSPVIILVQVSDEAGNSNTCMVEVTVQDKLAPNVVYCPPSIGVECNVDMFILEDAIFEDNCFDELDLAYEEELVPGCCETYILTRTWTATDPGGFSAICVQVITVSDNLPPVLDCEDFITVYLDEQGEVLVELNDVFNGATDACCQDELTPDFISELYTCEDIGVNFIYLNVSDACGNSAGCSIQVTVIDSISPVFNGCMDQMLLLSEIGSCEEDQIADPEIFGISATDNCDGNLEVSVDSLTINSNFCELPDLSVLSGIIYFSAVDSEGNSSLCSVVFTIENDVAPVFTLCVPEITLELDENGEISLDPSSVAVAIYPADCDRISATLQVNPDVSLDFTCADVSLSPIIVTFTAEACGSPTAECIVEVTIRENTPPTITCPSDISVSCDENLDPQNTGEPAYDDNCPDPELSFEDEILNQLCPYTYDIVRTFTVMDASGNTNTCSQNIFVSDNVAPIISCPQNMTLSCEDPQGPADTGFATATDNCDPNPSIEYSDSEMEGTCEFNFIITRIWTAEDACARTSQCVQTLTVSDITPPEFDPLCQEVFTFFTSGGSDCPADSDISLEVGQFVGNTETWTVGNNIIPSLEGCLSDNCSAESNLLARVDQIEDNEDNCSRTITVYFTILDQCGNESIEQFICEVNIIDDTDPVITCPDDISINCEDDTDPENTGYATATDDCDPMPEVIFLDQVGSGDCESSYTITRTWIAEDFCGNTSFCIQIIEVSDNTSPVFDIECQEVFDFYTSDGSTCPAESPISLVVGQLVGSSETWSVGNNTIPSLEGCLSDNCTDPADLVARVDQIDDNEDGCQRTITVYFTILDLCGNESADQFICEVNVIDDEAPELFCEENITLYLDENGEYEITESDLFFADPQDCNSVTVGFSPQSLTCDDVGESVFVSVVATDSCGLINSCVVSVMVLDTLAPEIIDCVAEYNFNVSDFEECELEFFTSVDQVPNPGVSDNCEISGTINRSASVIEEFCEGTAGLAIYEILFTVVDVNENSSTCVTIINVTDDFEPVLECVSDLTIYLDEIGEYLLDTEDLVLEITEYCDPNPIIIFEVIQYTCEDIGDHIIDLTITDCAGNLGTCAVNIAVSDTLAPVFTVCEDITVTYSDLQDFLGIQVCNVLMGQADPYILSIIEAEDNCDPDPLVFVQSRTVISPLCGDGIVVLLYTIVAEDESGNTSTCLSVVSLLYDLAPIVTFCDEEVNVYLDENGEAILNRVDVFTAVRGGLCPTQLSYSPTSVMFTCDDIGPNVVTFIVTQLCTIEEASTASCQVVVTVLDTISPFITCPADVTIDTDQGLCEAVFEYEVLYGDNCAEFEECGFTGIFAPENWVFDPDGGNGYVIESNLPQAITIVGSNPQPERKTTYCITIPAGQGGLITFDWYYTTVAETPMFNRFGYKINNQKTELSDNFGDVIQSGSASAMVEDFDVFCFELRAINNPMGDTTTVVISNLNNNCEGQGFFAQVSGIPSGGTFPLGTTINEFLVSDGAGNTATCSFSVTVEDNEAPEILCRNLTLELDENGIAELIPEDAVISVEDNCSEVFDYDADMLVFDCSYLDSSIVIVQIMVTDESGNSATCDIEVDFIDEIPPAFINCQDFTFQHSELEDCTPELDVLALLEASDNCESVLITLVNALVVHDFCETEIGSREIEAIYQAEDGSGNITLCTLSIFIVNDLEPEFILCEDITLIIGEDGFVELDLEDVALAEVSGACDLEISYNVESPLVFTCEDVGEHVIEVEASVCGGFTATCIFTVTIEQTSEFNLICPADTLIYCENDFERFYEEIIAEFEASGSCVSDTAIIVNESLNNCGLGTIEISLVIFDFIGGSDTCTTLITVELDPLNLFNESEIIWPEDISVSCSDIDPEITGEPIVESAQECIDTQFSYVDNPAGIVDGCELIDRIWTVTDNCSGISFDHTQLISRPVPGIPVQSGPPALVFAFADSDRCGTDVILDPVVGPLCADDIVIENSYNDGGADASDYYPVGETIVIYTLTNSCGEMNTYMITVQVFDLDAPVVTCAGNITVSCSDDIDQIIEDFPFSVIDNCPETLVLDTLVTYNLNDCGIGSIQLIFTATDEGANTGACTRTITVIGDPDFELDEADYAFPADTTLSCGSDISPDSVGYPVELSASFCSSVLYEFEDEVLEGEPENGCTTIQRTWIVTDTCSMSTISMVQNIILSADTPVFTFVPADITLESEEEACGAFVDLEPVEFASCANDITVSNDYNSGGADASGFYPVGETTIIFTAVNDCGNTSTASVVVVIEDVYPPSVSCPQNSQILCTEDIEAYLSSLIFEASDECGIEDTTIQIGMYVVECGAAEITITFTATDVNGLSSSCVTIVEVLPVLITSMDIDWPADITVNCDENTDPSETGFPVIGLNCGEVIVDYNDGTLIPDEDGCAYFFREWIVSDTCQINEEFRYIQTISLPNYSNLEDLMGTAQVIQANANPDSCEAYVTLLFPQSEFCAVDVTIENSYNDGGADASGFYPVGTTIVYFTISNECGVIFEDSATVIVNDITSPTMNCGPPSRVVDCATDIDSLIANWGIVVIEPCPYEEFLTVNYNLNDCGVGTITFNFQAIDIGNNGAECNRLIIVQAGVQEFDEDDITWPVSPLLLEDCAADIDPEVLGSFPTSDNPYLCLGLEFIFSDEEISASGDTCLYVQRTWYAYSNCSGDTLAEFLQEIIVIEENFGPIDVEGFVRSEYARGIEEVELVAGNNFRGGVYTNRTGYYKLHLNREAVPFILNPSKDGLSYEGVTVSDVMAVRSYLKFQNKDWSPYKQIAADVDRSGEITIADADWMVNVILGIEENFPKSNWRFVDASYEFTDKNQALKERFPESHEVTLDGGASQKANFVAVKIGDVNNSIDFEVQNRSNLNFVWQTSDIVTSRQGWNRIPVYAKNFSNLEAAQFTIAFQKHKTDQLFIESGDAGELYTHNTFDEKGLLAVCWIKSEDFSPTSDQPVFYINWWTSESVKLSEVMEFNGAISKPLHLDALMGEGIPNLEFSGFGGSSTAVYELFQNEPNPWSGETIIPYALPADADVSLLIFDINGKIVHSTEQNGKKGMNHIVLRPESMDLPDGVYYYHIKSGSFSASKKMLRIKSR